MLLPLLLLLHLLPCGDLACTRSLLSKQDQEVFVDDEDANTFLGRHLLFNRFDFEIFVPGNLERECLEEVCNYEEAREVFENIPATVKCRCSAGWPHRGHLMGRERGRPDSRVHHMLSFFVLFWQDAFWKKYMAEKDKRLTRVDVTSLLVGLIAAGVAVVIFGLLIWYFCQGKCKDGFSRASSIQVRPRRSNASLIMRRLEQVSLEPGLPPAPPPLMEEVDPPGLPSYEQAIAKSGQHDAPPPPYPGSQHGSIRR